MTFTLTGDEVSLEINSKKISRKKISSEKHKLKNDIKIGIFFMKILPKLISK